MSLTNGKRGRTPILCLRCRGFKFHEARGLCKCCYNHLAEGRCAATESLDDYPPLGGYGAAAIADGGRHITQHSPEPAMPDHLAAAEAAHLREHLDPGHLPRRIHV